MAHLRCMLTLGILLLAAAMPASAAWSPLGGPVEPVIELQLHPARPQLLYARSLGSESSLESYLWRSRNGGGTWSDVQTGLQHPATALAIDAADPERIWAWTTDGQLWRSNNAGETWTRRFATRADQILPDVGQLLADARRVYRIDSDSSGSRVAVSRDGGASFQLGAAGSHFWGTDGIFIHPLRDELVAFSTKGLEVSDDGGATWRLRGVYGNGFTGGRLAPSSPDVMYGLANRGPSNIDDCLARSDDAGAHWVAAARPPMPADSSFCYDMAVDPRAPRHVWVAVAIFEQVFRLRLFESKDGGSSWSRSLAVPGTGVVAAGGDVVYTAGSYAAGIRGHGLHVSTNGGRTWQSKDQGIIAGDLRQGFVAQRLPGGGVGRRLAALLTPPGDNPLALVRSNGGKDWVKALDRPTSVVDAGRPILIAVDARGIVRSQDGGETWSAVPSAPPDFGPLQSSLTRPQLVALSAFENVGAYGRIALWTSDDAGLTWRRSSNGLPIDCTHVASVDWCPSFQGYAADPFDAGRRWVARGGTFPFAPQLFLSEDSGATWRVVATELPSVEALAADAVIKDRLLAGTSQGLFLSEDGGRHWQSFGDGLPDGAEIRQLALDARSAAWYAATTSRGIYRSLDNGSTWTLLDGAPDLDAPTIAVDPRLPTALLAAFRGQGAWRWTP